ncbi:hypothetical protein [Pedobacter alpinus]|uniref:hypothetical protein n=1 Tax=Pedobacter alpinus TaxID=1590643 RepID=UPI00366B5693
MTAKKIPCLPVGRYCNTPDGGKNAQIIQSNFTLKTTKEAVKTTSFVPHETLFL